MRLFSIWKEVRSAATRAFLLNVPPNRDGASRECRRAGLAYSAKDRGLPRAARRPPARRGNVVTLRFDAPHGGAVVPEGGIARIDRAVVTSCVDGSPEPNAFIVWATVLIILDKPVTATQVR